MTSPARTLLADVETSLGRPALLHADAAGDPTAWAAENRWALREAVTAHGAVYVRGLGLRDAAMVGAVLNQLGAPLMAEREPFAPRRSYPDGVYSSTKWPSNQQMCSHHELSYTLEFPGLMMFACLTAPNEGGATAVADAADVLRAMPADLVARFEREGWMLTRSYNDEIGANWTEAFGTEDRATVEAYCHANAIAFEWQPDGGLRTRQRRSAIVRHPISGERCWFNQVAFLNEWTMAPDVHEFLVDEYGQDGLPFNTRFGNGEEISAEVVNLLGEIYDQHTRREPWRSGDLLVVDNIRTAHSREAFTGPREVLVGMADAVRLADCSPTVEVMGR
jgi:alpha-ketoglutarate-dependent taurine dioxygenase